MKVKVLSLLFVGLLSVLFASCEKKIGTTNVGLLTKQDSLEIEQLTGRKIIGAIDTTLLTSSERKSLGFYLNRERDFVKRSVDMSFDYNLSEYFSVIHFFYNDDLNCQYDCPDMFVWFPDNEAEKLRKHIGTLKSGDSIIIEEGDTIIRTISKRHCGVTFGVNVQWIGSDDNKVPTKIHINSIYEKCARIRGAFVG